MSGLRWPDPLDTGSTEETPEDDRELESLYEQGELECAA